MRRFRADSFAVWRRWLEQASAEPVDDAELKAGLERIRGFFEAELAAAELTWNDVPKQPNSWGPGMRTQLGDLGLAPLYDTFFAAHSNYVHASWHELRTFHLEAGVDGSHRVSLEFGGPGPPALYQLAAVVVRACADYARAGPGHRSGGDRSGRGLDRRGAGDRWQRVPRIHAADRARVRRRRLNLTAGSARQRRQLHPAKGRTPSCLRSRRRTNESSASAELGSRR